MSVQEQNLNLTRRTLLTFNFLSYFDRHSKKANVMKNWIRGCPVPLVEGLTKMLQRDQIDEPVVVVHG